MDLENEEEDRMDIMDTKSEFMETEKSYSREISPKISPDNKTQIFFGNDTFYIFFRLFQVF